MSAVTARGAGVAQVEWQQPGLGPAAFFHHTNLSSITSPYYPPSVTMVTLLTTGGWGREREEGEEREMGEE